MLAQRLRAIGALAVARQEFGRIGARRQRRGDRRESLRGRRRTRLRLGRARVASALPALFGRPGAAVSALRAAARRSLRMRRATASAGRTGELRERSAARVARPSDSNCSMFRFMPSTRRIRLRWFSGVVQRLVPDISAASAASIEAPASSPIAADRGRPAPHASRRAGEPPRLRPRRPLLEAAGALRRIWLSSSRDACQCARHLVEPPLDAFGQPQAVQILRSAAGPPRRRARAAPARCARARPLPHPARFRRAVSLSRVFRSCSTRSDQSRISRRRQRAGRRPPSRAPPSSARSPRGARDALSRLASARAIPARLLVEARVSIRCAASRSASRLASSARWSAAALQALEFGDASPECPPRAARRRRGAGSAQRPPQRRRAANALPRSAPRWRAARPATRAASRAVVSSMALSRSSQPLAASRSPRAASSNASAKRVSLRRAAAGALASARNRPPADRSLATASAEFARLGCQRDPLRRDPARLLADLAERGEFLSQRPRDRSPRPASRATARNVAKSLRSLASRPARSRSRRLGLSAPPKSACATPRPRPPSAGADSSEATSVNPSDRAWRPRAGEEPSASV